MAAPTLADATIYRGSLTRPLSTTTGITGAVVPLSALMVSSDGGKTITAWSVTLTGGTAGHFNVTTDGNCPGVTATGASSQLNGGPYTFSVTATNADGTSSAKTLTINVRADTYTVATPLEVSSSTKGLKAVAAQLGGKTIEIATGSEATWATCNGGDAFVSTGRISMSGFSTHTGRFTIQSENTAYVTYANNSWTTISAMILTAASGSTSVTSTGRAT
jgi:hypothetical protein